MWIFSSGESFILCLLPLSPPELLGSLNSIRNASYSSQRCQGYRGQCTREGGPQPTPRATKEKIWKATSRCSPSDQEDGKPQSFSFDYEGVQRIHTQIFQGYDALESYMEDSLSSCLLYRITMSLTPAAKKIWDNAVTKREVKPTFGYFMTYLENRLDQLAPSNQSNSNPSSSSASFTSSPSPAKNKVKSNPKSLACVDKHRLNKCSVFASFNTD